MYKRRFGLILVLALSIFLSGCGSNSTGNSAAVATKITANLQNEKTGAPLLKLPQLQFLCEKTETNDDSLVFTYAPTYDSASGNLAIDIVFLGENKSTPECFMTTVGCDPYGFDNAMNVHQVGVIEYGKTIDLGIVPIKYCQ